MHELGVRYLNNPVIFHDRMPYYAERVYQKCGLDETVWEFIDGTFCKTCHPSFFQELIYSGIVVTNSAMESSLSELLRQMACLHPYKVW